MRKILKWIGLIAGAIIVTTAIIIAVLILRANSRLDKLYVIPVEAILISSNSSTVQGGGQIARSICSSCHEQNLAGVLAFTAADSAEVNSDALTGSGAGRSTPVQDEDWMGNIRIGVENEQVDALSLPSPEFYFFSDEDLTLAFAHLRSEPPEHNTMKDPSLPAMVKLLWVMDAFGDLD